jgi:hypothetical protein
VENPRHDGHVLVNPSNRADNDNTHPALLDEELTTTRTSESTIERTVCPRAQHWLQGVYAKRVSRFEIHIRWTMEDRLEVIRNALCDDRLCLKKSGDHLGIFEYVESFVELSRGNEHVRSLELYPYDEEAGNNELWDKVGQGVGNLKSLRTLSICLKNVVEGVNDEGNVSNPDWEILARVLRYVNRDIKLDFSYGHGHLPGTEEMRDYA